MDVWAHIEEFYGKGGTFLCGDGDGRETEVEVTHIMGEGASKSQVKAVSRKLGRALPEKHVEFLKRMDGGIFFTQMEPKRCEAGFVIYPCEMIAKEHKGVLDSWLAGYRDNDGKCQHWIDNIIVIGEELCSGNYLILDMTRADDPENPPVAFLDHETAMAGAFREKEETIIADTVEGMLVRASENPVDFLMNVLGAITRYADATYDGWYPVAFRQKDGEVFIYGSE